jgi:ABC-type microcin C transport system permease subunit YejB
MDSTKGVDDFIKHVKEENVEETADPASATDAYLEALALSIQREQRFQQEMEDRDADISLKKTCGWTITTVLGLWELFVIVIVSIHLGSKAVKLSDTVLITLLTSATANILALPTIVLNYLFPKRHKD